MSPAQPANPRRRGPARSFTRDQVVGAALDELRDSGIDAVSFRSVSRRLGVNPMALYTYVADKDELLAAMFDQVFRAIGDTLADGAPRQVLTTYFTGAYRLMVEYADLFRLVRPTAAGMDRDLAERVYRMLADLGVAPERIADVHLALLELTIGSAIAASARRPVLGLPSDDPERPLLSAVVRRVGELDVEEHFGRTFGLLLDALVNGGRDG
ncbi:TetR/AcrR family transcriptional regulator [Amycolatopsis jejuensis]|uniref:TetR/AcrR family transcriptional regulator n=1 Tax=Amycolatopsis jejuensis TaxID=330084 RepID=UPI00068B6ADD|nr:TetR/AcrR family transcriptional regulator [Amycolatopsis jejuensis]